MEPAATVDVTGKHGGTLSWAEVGEVGVFNPVMTETVTEADLKRLVFDQLVNYDNSRWEFEPMLAWKWEHSEDWLTWTFHLRKGVVWNDGEPFTADDVIFSYEAIKHPKVPNSIIAGFRVGDAPLPELTKLDDHTVRFVLSVVNSTFLTQVSTLYLVPEHKWADTIQGEEATFAEQMNAKGDLSDVVGTGPFRVVDYQGAQRVVYERNPYYWAKDSAGERLPYVDRIIVLLTKDLSTRSVQFLNGEFDIVQNFQPPEYKQFRHREKEGWFRIHRLGLALQTNWISFNQYPGNDSSGEPYLEPHKYKWFTNRTFRRAMSHAVDRKKLVRLFLRGKGEAIYEQTNRGNKTWYFEHTTFPYDTARAKALLDEIGYTDRDGDGVREDPDGHPIQFNLMTNVENPMRVNIIAQIKADWTAIGIDCRTHPVNFQELVSKLMDGHRWDTILLGWGSAVPPDPLNSKNILLSSGRLHVWHPMQSEPANEFEAEGDRIILEMDTSPDIERRRELWKGFLEHEAQELPIIYLYSPNSYSASKTRVQNVRASVLRPEVWHNAHELWLEDQR